MSAADARGLHPGFLIFGLWYVGFGLAAFQAELNAPFFRVPIEAWDGMHRALLAFGGVYTLHIAIWALQMARLPRRQSRSFAISLGLILMFLIPAFVGFLQWRWSVFTPAGLAAFAIDIVFGAYFLASARRIPRAA